MAHTAGMSWLTGSLVSIRERFALAALQERELFAQLCRRFRIARSTGYKWLHRFRRHGCAGLRDRSRRPHHSPRQLALRWRQALRQLRRRHPTWGPRKLRARLRHLHPRVHLPVARTFARWLRRLELVPPPARATNVMAHSCRHPSARWRVLPTISGRSTSKGGFARATAPVLSP